MITQSSSFIQWEIHNKVACVLLNRPAVLNVMNIEMVRELSELLKHWEDDPKVNCVILQGAGPKAFCAGGDLRRVYNASLQSLPHELRTIFREGYRLSHQLASFPKSCIALIHGYAMGGGLGACIYGSHRIVCKNIKMAMPEVTIGYFPDVGASFFLNQAPGYVGTYFALTAHPMNAADALYMGLATDYVPQKSFPLLKQDIIDESPSTPEDIETLVERYSLSSPLSSLELLRPSIDKIFGQDDFDDLFHSLHQEDHPFFKTCLKTMTYKSPLSLKITFELMKRMQHHSLKECLEMDFLMAQKFIKKSDFFEGIRALIIDKDYCPLWQPKTLDEVNQDIVEEYFTNFSDQRLFD